MRKILEIWGNGVNVLIKTKEEFGGDSWCASKWLPVNSNYSQSFLDKQGYKKLKLDSLRHIDFLKK